MLRTTPPSAPRSVRQLPADVKELLALVVALAAVAVAAVLLVLSGWQLPFVATYAVMVAGSMVAYAVTRRMLFVTPRAVDRKPQAPAPPASLPHDPAA